MVQDTQKEKDPYRITFHKLAKSDMADINVGWHEPIYDAIEYKLGIAPTVLGEPLRHSGRLLWRAKFSKVRIVYTIIEPDRELVVLAIEKRDTVYKVSHLDRLTRIAELIHRTRKDKNG